MAVPDMTYHQTGSIKNTAPQTHKKPGGPQQPAAANSSSSTETIETIRETRQYNPTTEEITNQVLWLLLSYNSDSRKPAYHDQVLLTRHMGIWSMLETDANYKPSYSDRLDSYPGPLPVPQDT
jgi:hypothetical protein